jgi:hypothetical protein
MSNMAFVVPGENTEITIRLAREGNESILSPTRCTIGQATSYCLEDKDCREYLRWDSERDLNVESQKMATTISRDRYSRFIVMDTVGIEANIQQAIMDPKFKSVKLMEHWLKESKIVPGGG